MARGERCPEGVKVGDNCQKSKLEIEEGPTYSAITHTLNGGIERKS